MDHQGSSEGTCHPPACSLFPMSLGGEECRPVTRPLRMSLPQWQPTAHIHPGSPQQEEKSHFATFCDLVREPCWREGGGMELREVLFTELTGFLVFKNPKCKTCYQIIENSIFIYSVLPKTGKTWQHFLVSKRLRKE